MWKKIKDKRDKFWIGRESDDLKGHLNQTDKHFLLYGYFVINILTVVLVLLILGISNLWAAWRNAADMEKIMNAMKSYVGLPRRMNTIGLPGQYGMILFLVIIMRMWNNISSISQIHQKNVLPVKETARHRQFLSV